MKNENRLSKRRTHKIMVLEDEEGMRRGLRLNLEAEGFEVLDYSSADSAFADLKQIDKVSLGIFDIMLPGKMDGLEFCRRIRSEKKNFPVIFLTARNRLEDKLEGFNAGGDDYLTKPFELEELLARVYARLRQPELNSSSKQISAELIIGDFVINLEAGSAIESRTKKIVRFNKRETEILRLLAEHRGKPVSRDQILDRVWGFSGFPSNRTVDNFILKFRKVFEPEPDRPQYIITRHGIGYELANEK